MIEKIQKQFLQAIFHADPAGLNFIVSDYPDARIAIYRQTIFENLRHALSIVFPGVWKLLGDECANSAAYAFSRNMVNLPDINCLNEWGGQFPDFLESLNELQSLPYLKDYACYEWFKHLAYGAEEVKVVSKEDWQKIPEDLIGDVKLVFVPSFFLCMFSYPVNEIQAMLDDADSPGINLHPANTFALIVRVDNEVRTIWLEKSAFVFFKMLKQGADLQQAYEETCKHDEMTVNLTQILIIMLKNNMIHRVIPKPS